MGGSDQIGENKNYFFLCAQVDFQDSGTRQPVLGPTSRDSFEAWNEPILDFLDTKSIATDALETNLALFLRHLAE